MSKRFFLYVAPVCLAFLAAGCGTLSGIPEINRATIEPEQLHPGDVAVIKMNVSDEQDIIDRIIGIVLEYPDVEIQLRDDGQETDDEAGDKVWTRGVEVPEDAPYGNFTIEFTAYRSDGQPVTVRTETGDVQPLQARVIMTVVNPAMVQQ